MPGRPWAHRIINAAIAASLALTACGGNNDPAPDHPVTIVAVGPNAVSYWNEVATTTINVAAAAGGTAEEARPNYAVDLATVHVAIYDAVMAIDGAYRPFAITPVATGSGASPEAATAAAAYGVLKALFPNRTASYQAAYDAYIAALPDGTPKTLGLALGGEVAGKVVALRASDGRAVVLAPFVSGTAAGQFRTATNPVGREYPSIKPFLLGSAAQFRAPTPPALTSAAYAADVNETRALGSLTSTTRTAAQTEIARFHTEPPFAFWPRNLRTFATTNASVADQARLMAMLWVTHADTQTACFESKYTYLAWRPTSAITLDGDGNDATTADPAWTPVVATPNHPEFPAAHACIAGAMTEVLRAYYGTPNITFDMTSTVTASTHHFTTAAALVDEVTVARIAGGMHFRSAVVAGETLGRGVADWTLGHAFQRR